jgi:hypothetical protein
MEHDAKDFIMALDYDDMPNGMMDNAEEVEDYNIPVEMTLALDNDSLPDEDVEEYYDPYYAEQMEDQGSARSKPERRDDHDKAMKRCHKQQQKRRTVCMNQEKQGLTDRVEMRDVYEDPMQPEELDCVIMVHSKMPVIKAEKMDTAEAVETYITPIEISTEEHDQIVMARIASRTVIGEATEEMSVCLEILLEELVTECMIEEIIDQEEKSWIAAPLRPEGGAQKERTGLLRQDGSEIYNNYYAQLEHGTEIVEQDMYEHRNYAKNGRDALGRFIIEDGSYRMIPKQELISSNTFSGPEIPQGVQEQEEVQIEIDEDLYAQRNYAKDGRDAMGRFIIEDGSGRMIPKPKLNAKQNRQRKRMEMLNRTKDDGPTMGEAKSAAQKRFDKLENAKRAAVKAQAQAVMDANRQARKRAQRRFLLGLPPTRRKAISEEQQRLNTERADAKQKMLRDIQTAYLHELALKHDLQQQEGRYVKAPCYLKTADKKEADRRYLAQAMEMGADLMKAGTLANSKRATQIEEQVMQDWTTRHKLSRNWGKIMQGRSKVRIRALKREPYKQATVWVGSKVTKPGVPVPKKAPLHTVCICYGRRMWWEMQSCRHAEKQTSFSPNGHVDCLMYQP